MKKRYIVIIALAGFIGLAWTIVRLTNILAIYTVPTNSNFPTIKSGDRIFASRLVSPKRFDFITFYTTTEQFGKQIYTQRLCGLPGDTIEIKAGDLYINGLFADSGLTLAHFYKVPIGELQKVKGLMTPEEQEGNINARDSILVNLADAEIKKLSLTATKQLQSPFEKNDEIFKSYKKEMNADYFGPVVVPVNKYFLLGDNRSASQDSRYLGFADNSDYIATVLEKK